MNGNNMSDKFIPPSPLNTAVLFLVFNRLDTTKQVFEAIREAKPPSLYVAADGAREDKETEDEKVKAVREYVMNQIDWQCEVKTLFREKNLGCKYAVNGAIDWFFENEEMGIILEDDCLPSQSFFWFCEELLVKYKDDLRMFLISGYNKQNNWKQNKNDYFFSNFGGIWGWASWSSAWAHNDIKMSDIESFIEEGNFQNLLGDNLGSIREKNIYTNIIKNKIDTWDYQWGYARNKNNGLSCIPSKSLIKNIGFGEEATHTFGENKDGVKKHEIDFPLKTNEFIVPDKVYDELFIGNSSFKVRILSKLKRILNDSKKKFFKR